MKKIIFLLAVFALVAGCSKEKGGEDDGGGGGTPPQDISILRGATVQVTGVNILPKSITTDQEDEITDSVKFVAKYAVESASTLGKITFLDRRDVENGLLFWREEDVIHADGSLGNFIVNTVKDYVIEGNFDEYGNRVLWDYPGPYADLIIDTIAYIPNAVIAEAQEKIKEAYRQGDYEEVKRLFDEAFVFIPTTGEKWRAMKSAGIE